MKLYYKGVLCRLADYRVMGEDRPALYPVGSPDLKTILDAGFIEVHYGLWAKILSDEEYKNIKGNIDESVSRTGFANHEQINAEVRHENQN